MHSTNPIRMIAMISSFSLAPHSAARSPAALKRLGRFIPRRPEDSSSHLVGYNPSGLGGLTLLTLWLCQNSY